MSKREFLVELGTEELPPKALNKLSNAFTSGLEQGLKDANLNYDSIRSFATPRRLAILVGGLDETQPDSMTEKVGPAVKAAFDSDGNPTKAAAGFARSCGVDVSDLGTITKDGIEKLYYTVNKTGADTTQLLPDLVSNSLDKLPIPKRMRWGASRIEFVRPVHWCVLLFGSEFIEAEILGVASGHTTRGHRFHFDKPIPISSPSEYERVLEDKGFVIADFNKRKELIRNQVLGIVKERSANAVIDESLLEEVTALVEFPVALCGDFDEVFLDVPPEALILAMKSHQKYFHMLDSNGKLLPSFISVSNIQSKDPGQVVAGNEKVIRPRLADARFFYETDLKSTLESHIDRLKTVVFQEQLGTVYAKSQRVTRLAVYIAEQLGGEVSSCKRAASLAKCDLLTNMVGEFADLQGLMGYYYALKDGENTEVASAIVEQYLPRYAGDSLPTTLTGSVVSLAEKLDTIIGLFAIKQPPTGSKDPFAIRRAALGVLRILVETRHDLDLEATIEFALAGFEAIEVENNTSSLVLEFLLDRFRAWYADQNVSAEVFHAVRALRPTSPLDFDSRIAAVNSFFNLEQSSALAAANKRVGNLIAKGEGDLSLGEVDTKLFDSEAENALYKALCEKEVEVAPMIENGNYQGYLASLTSLRDPIDTFFDEVLVMSENPSVKNNRLQLLSKLRNLFLRVADVSLLHSA